MIFLWFFFLEFLLVGKKLHKDNLEVIKWTKVLVATSVAAVPTAYIAAVSVFGLNHKIVEIGQLF